MPEFLTQQETRYRSRAASCLEPDTPSKRIFIRRQSHPEPLSSSSATTTALELTFSSTRQRHREVNLPVLSPAFSTSYFSSSSSSSPSTLALSPPSSSLDESEYLIETPPPQSNLSTLYPRGSPSRSSLSSTPSTDGCTSPYANSPYLEASSIFSYRPRHPEPGYNRIAERREYILEQWHFLWAPVIMANTPLKRKVVILGSPSVGE